MEVLRDCQSPIEMNSFDMEVNSKSDGLAHEKQAMIPANSNENALLNNNNHSNAAGMLVLPL